MPVDPPVHRARFVRVELTFDPTSPGMPTPVSLDSSAGVLALVCPTIGQCTIVDTSGREVTFDPESPATPTPVTVDSAPLNALLSVSCPSTTQCSATDLGQRVVTFNPLSPGTPSSTALVGLHIGRNPVVCPSTTQCITFGFPALTFDPGAPTNQTRESIPGLSGLTRAACPSTSYCVVVSSYGTAAEGDPTNADSWTLDAIPDAGALTGVACGSALECVAVNAGGVARVGTGTAVIATTAPVSTSLPAITGTPTVGKTLSASTGTWSGSPPLSFTYQWVHCTSLCADIAGATSSTYTIVTSDVNTRIEVVVAAKNAAGSASVASNLVGPVAAALPSAAKIKALLLRQLMPHGKAFRIGALLKRGYAFSFAPPSAGRLAISWYLVRKGTSPVLIALGHKTFGSTRASVTITLNARGKRLLRLASRVKLTSKIAFTPSHHATIGVTQALVVKR